MYSPRRCEARRSIFLPSMPAIPLRRVLIVATINTLLSGMAGIEGRKMLLLASHRLGEYIGAEFYYAAGLRETVIPPLERAEIDNRGAVRSIIANANASDVTIYPIFPTGLDYTPADPTV